jgi:hypothetical protein
MCKFLLLAAFPPKLAVSLAPAAELRPGLFCRRNLCTENSRLAENRGVNHNSVD